MVMNPPALLPSDIFFNIVRYAPLISIDIVVEDHAGRIFLGLRTNEPAKGTYFVPGGIIRKGEKINEAFVRILQTEMGLVASIGEARFLGVFEHFYDANKFGADGFGTHYVVLAYAISCGSNSEIITDAQHSNYRWSSAEDIRASADVHPNTKAYFIG
jgi:colanic acid biosynthesis protein WcaH